MSTEENASKQNEKTSEQTETRASSSYTNKSYLDNLPLLSTPLGKYISEQLVT